MTSRIQRVEIPCGQGGLNGTRDLSRFPLTDLTVADDVTYEDGTWRKDGGAVKVNTTALSGSPRVLGLWDFVLNNGSQYLVAATGDGKIVTVVTGGIGSTLQTGLAANRLTVFVEGGGGTTKKLFRFNGADPVGVTSNGTTMSTISGPTADWTGTNQPTFGTLHNSYLWALGNANAPDRLYRSNLADHEDFSTVGQTATFNIFPGESGGLVSACSYKGRLFLFKQRGIYWLDDSNVATADLATGLGTIVRRLTTAVGLAGPRAWCYIPDDVLFLGSDGLIHRLSGVNALGDAALSGMMHEELGNVMHTELNHAAMSGIVADYYGAKSKAIFCLPQRNSTVNNRKLILDFRKGSPPQAAWSVRDVCESLCIRKDANGMFRPCIGDGSGFVWMLDDASRAKDGVGYNFRAGTREIDLVENVSALVNLQYLEVTQRVSGTVRLQVDVELDGAFSQSLVFNESVVGDAIPSFTIGTSALVDAGIVTSRQLLLGDAKRMKLTSSDATLASDPNIVSMVLGFTPGAESRGG